MDSEKSVIEDVFIMLKPEAVKHNLIGRIIDRIEKAGFKIVAMKMLRASLDQAERLYEVHKGKPFYEELIRHITSGPIVAMVVRGENAVKKLRKMAGATDPREAEKGTIRGDFGISITENVIHVADSLENSRREIPIFFSEMEIY